MGDAGSVGILDRLLAAGADVAALTNDQWTPLHEAALNGHAAAVERLLRANAQVARRSLHACDKMRSQIPHADSVMCPYCGTAPTWQNS